MLRSAKHDRLCAGVTYCARYVATQRGLALSQGVAYNTYSISTLSTGFLYLYR